MKQPNVGERRCRTTPARSHQLRDGLPTVKPCADLEILWFLPLITPPLPEGTSGGSDRRLTLHEAMPVTG
jgi:hypothetical protein